MLCLCTCKICGYFPPFCSYFISFILPVRPCFPSRCLWKGEMPELLPESLSWFFGKTWFPRCAMYSTHPAWAGDCLRAFVQQGWVLLSGDLFLSFPVADVSASNFLWLLLEQNNQVCAFKQICAEASSVCSGAFRTCKHPRVTEAVINGAAVLVSAHWFAGLRSPRSLDPLVKRSWQRQLTDAAACAAILGLYFEIWGWKPVGEPFEDYAVWCESNSRRPWSLASSGSLEFIPSL